MTEEEKLVNRRFAFTILALADGLVSRARENLASAYSGVEGEPDRIKKLTDEIQESIWTLRHTLPLEVYNAN